MEAIKTSIVNLAVCIRNKQTKEVVFQVDDQYGLNTQEGIVIDDGTFSQFKKVVQDILNVQTPKDAGVYEWSVHILYGNNHFWMTGDSETPVHRRALKIYTEDDEDDWGLYFSSKADDEGNDLTDPLVVRRLIRELEKDLGRDESKLVLFRGLPGSGKTTMAKKRLSERLTDVHFEGDDFFTADSGEYNFDPKKIKDAHLLCQLKTRQALSIGMRVSVANTFVQNWEIEPYIKMAQEYDIPVEIVECSDRFENIHDVPVHVIERMEEKWEEVNIESMLTKGEE